VTTRRGFLGVLAGAAAAVGLKMRTVKVEPAPPLPAGAPLSNLSDDGTKAGSIHHKMHREALGYSQEAELQRWYSRDAPFASLGSREDSPWRKV
jgi:hypothetical protein